MTLELDRDSFNTSECSNMWASYSFYTEGFNVLEAKNNSTSSSLDSFGILRGGLNYPIGNGFKMRGYLELGNQQGTRVLEPKKVSTDFWGSDLRLQWSSKVLDSFSIGLESGYRFHKLPQTSYTKLEQGNIAVTAAPGNTLVDVSAEDDAWFIAGRLYGEITDGLSLHIGGEYRDVTVKATTTSDDPSIQTLLAIQQVPQSTPWQEKHIIRNIGLDWQLMKKVGIALDYKQYKITRFNYQIRTGFVDYNETDQVDFYLTYKATPEIILFAHSRYISHYLLGDTPALYNRRNNHTFKKPFGFLTLGAQF